MPHFFHVADTAVRSVLESERPAHRADEDVARALRRTLQHLHRDSLDDSVAVAAVELRAAHYIRAEAAWSRGNKVAAIAALRAVWSDQPRQARGSAPAIP